MVARWLYDCSYRSLEEKDSPLFQSVKGRRAADRESHHSPDVLRIGKTAGAKLGALLTSSHTL